MNTQKYKKVIRISKENGKASISSVYYVITNQVTNNRKLVETKVPLIYITIASR